MDMILGERSYRANDALNAIDQFHVARKLGNAIPIIDGLVRKENQAKSKELLLVLMFGRLSDEDAEFVMRKCLSVVQVEQPTGWAKLQSKDGQLLFSDVGIADLLKLTMAVIEENLGDFFRTALSGLEAA